MRLRREFKALLKKSSFSKKDIILINKAFIFARSAHIYQKRRSGEPYWHHLVGVAMKLIKLNFPLEYILASLLHDCPEDAGTSIGVISKRFGYYVAFLVDFMSRNRLCGYSSYEEKIGIILKEYPWAIFLRLADISHNMETPQYYKKTGEKIKEAEMFIEVGELVAIQIGEEVLKEINSNIFPNGLFGFIKRLEDKINKAKTLEKN